VSEGERWDPRRSIEPQVGDHCDVVIPAEITHVEDAGVSWSILPDCQIYYRPLDERDEEAAPEPDVEPPPVGLLEYEWRRPDGVVLQRRLVPEDERSWSWPPLSRARDYPGLTYWGEQDVYVRYQVPGAIWQHVRHFDAVVEETRP